jgi:hypothetical protein
MSNVVIIRPKTVLDAQRALELYKRYGRAERFDVALEINGLDTIREVNFTDLKCMYSGDELSKYRGLRWSNVVNNPNIKWDFPTLSYNPFSVS